MHVTNTQGLTVELLVGPAHGASRIFIWAVAAPEGQSVGMHYHGGEEIIRVLYGRLHVRVEDSTRQLTNGEILIVPAGTRHGYRAEENSEIEVYGEIGSGEFLVYRDDDGTERVEEIFMAGAPWSRQVETDPAAYCTHEELLERYRESIKGYSLEIG